MSSISGGMIKLSETSALIFFFLFLSFLTPDVWEENNGNEMRKQPTNKDVRIHIYLVEPGIKHCSQALQSQQHKSAGSNPHLAKISEQNSLPYPFLKRTSSASMGVARFTKWGDGKGVQEGWPGLQMAALHRPLYKMSFHLGSARGGVGAGLLTKGALPLATPLPAGDITCINLAEQKWTVLLEEAFEISGLTLNKIS